MSGILKFVNEEQVQKKYEKYQCVYVILYYKLYNDQKRKGAMHWNMALVPNTGMFVS